MNFVRNAGFSRRSFVRRAMFGAVAAGAMIGAGRSEAKPESAGTKLILLGTGGGPIIRQRRSQPANLLLCDGTPYLIDCGVGTIGQLLRAGYRPVDLRAAFITHNHWDHNGDLAPIIGFDWIEGRRQPLDLVGPPGTRTMTNAALEYFSVPERIFSQEALHHANAAQLIRVNEVNAGGVIYKDDKISVTAVENTHYANFRSDVDKSFSYRFNTPTRSIVFTGDTGPSDAVAQLAAGADVLVTEVIDADAAIIAASKDVGVKPDFNGVLAQHMRREHLVPEEVGKLAARAGVKMVVLSHIAPALDDDIDVSHYVDGVRKYYNGCVIAGMDLLEI